MSIYTINNSGEKILNLSTILIDKLPRKFKVDGTLNCSGSSITELPKGLIVRGDLILENSLITEIPDEMIVCGRVYYNNPDLKIPRYFTAAHGYHYKGQILHKIFKDDDFIITKKYIYFNKQLVPYANIIVNQENQMKFYQGVFEDLNFVSYKDEHFAIVKNSKEAWYKVRYWQAKERGSDQYKGLTLQSKLTLSEAARMYQIFTGACEEGIQNFINSLENPKDEYTVEEVITLTLGLYENEVLKKFFYY